MGKLLELCPSYPARNGLAQIRNGYDLTSTSQANKLSEPFGEHNGFRIMPLNARTITR